MKKYSHAWIAFMAIKRLEVIASTEDASVVKGVSDSVRAEAKALVKWFKDYRDFVIEGAWYPDDVFKDMGSSHIVKYRPSEDAAYSAFGKLPSTHTIFQKMTNVKSPLLEKPYVIEGGNCADRCESISHSIVDNFKMLHREERGCPIATTGNHIAMRFFILSHYIADCHMPLHCDARPFSDGKGIHGAIEKKWEDQVNKSYKIDKANNRFFYDPDGYPLHLNPTQFVLDVEHDVETRKYAHGWGNGNNNTWDFMSVVSQYSYVFSYYLIPETFKNTQTIQEFMEQTEWGHDFDKYSVMIFGDAIDSLARIWLHVWIKFRNWLK
jgi:hypothetical protein